MFFLSNISFLLLQNLIKKIKYKNSYPDSKKTKCNSFNQNRLILIKWSMNNKLCILQIQNLINHLIYKTLLSRSRHKKSYQHICLLNRRLAGKVIIGEQDQACPMSSTKQLFNQILIQYVHQTTKINYNLVCLNHNNIKQTYQPLILLPINHHNQQTTNKYKITIKYNNY